MKKIVVWIAIVSMLLGLTACGQQATQSAYPGTMTELVEGIYRNCTQQPEFALGDPTPIDTSDAFALQSYLGLTDASLVQEAVFSEPMINAQAYSLCALRVAEGKNPKDVAQGVLDGVDPRKWICVEADQVRVGVWGDTVVLAMVSSDLAPNLADDLMTAYSKTVGGDLEVILKK